MIQLLLDNPLLLLFLVAALGYLLGRVKVGGSSLGVAAVLFVGLAMGALDPGLKLPELVYQLGLVLFVYTVGLNSGPGFFASFRRKGWRDNLFVVGVLIFALFWVWLLARWLKLSPGQAAGIYAGSLTNTPALASVLDYLKQSTPPALLDAVLAEPVIGYSLAYPMGVIGMIMAIAILSRHWRIDYAAEGKQVHAAYAVASAGRLRNCTVRVTKPTVIGQSIGDLRHRYGWDVVFGRLKRGNQLLLASEAQQLAADDLVSVVGVEQELAEVITQIGAPSPEQLELDRSRIDYRRIFVSNPRVAGHQLRELNLPQQFGAIITRVRRGDIEFPPHGDTVLELGDRIRVVTARERMDVVSRFFGDSYRALSEIDVLSFSLGITLGLLVGNLPLPLPGGFALKLGLAGGPLLVAMVLATLRRSGPLLWNIPYSANLTLRQTGLVLFLAGVGTRSGYAFVTTLSQGGGLLVLAGAFVTLATGLTMLWVGHRWLDIPMSLLMGMMAGAQTQPAVLGFAQEQSGNDLPNIGYAAVYPIAMITKILLAQLLLTL